MNKCDTRLQRIDGRKKSHFFSVDGDASRIGLDDASEDIHQRRFSGAVFSEQRVYFTCVYGKRYAVENGGFTERFADIPHFNFHALPCFIDY